MRRLLLAVALSVMPTVALSADSVAIAGNYEDWLYDTKLAIGQHGTVRTNMTLTNNGVTTPLTFASIQALATLGEYGARGTFSYRFTNAFGTGWIDCQYPAKLRLTEQANGDLIGVLTYPTYPSITPMGQCVASVELSRSEFEFVKIAE